MGDRSPPDDATSVRTNELSTKQQAPAPPPTDYKLESHSHQGVFSRSVIILLVYAAFSMLSTFIMHYYITMTFIPFCLLPEQAKIILNHFQRYFNVQGLLFLTVAVVADNYVRKEWVYKILVGIGSFSTVFLCYLASISAQYEYTRSFELKEKLYIIYCAFQSLNDNGRPLMVSLLFDQITNLKDFTLGTTRILSVFLMSKEVVKAVTYAQAIYTSQDKTAAAQGQIIPPILSFSTTSLFVFLTWRNYPLISYKPAYNSIWKILGCIQQILTLSFIKRVFRIHHYHRYLVTYSDRTIDETKLFWRINTVLICLYPYYYGTYVTELLAFINIDSGRKGQAVRHLYVQCIKIAFLGFSQFMAFPLLYRTRLRRILSSPMKRMITFYGFSGICACMTFIIVFFNQKKGLDVLQFKETKLIFMYNMLNHTVNLELFNNQGIDPVDIPPYDRHLVVLGNSMPLPMSLICKKLYMEDYYQLEVEDNDVLFITGFGLEGVKMIERKSVDVRECYIITVCLLLVCRGRVVFDCDGQTNTFELHVFGEKTKMSVKMGSKCTMNHYSEKGSLTTENSPLEILVSNHVYYIAVVENARNDILMKLLPVDVKPDLNLWWVLPIDLLSSWSRMIFEVALFQFLIIEGVPSFQTILIAVGFCYENVAKLSIQKWLKVDGLVSEKNAFIFSVVYFVGFVWFLTRLKHFSTADRIDKRSSKERQADLKPAGSTKEIKKINNRCRFWEPVIFWVRFQHGCKNLTQH